MKLIQSTVAALALAAAGASHAATTVLDFDHVASFASIGNAYAGVSFGGDALALANDELGPYFTNAPSALGVMTAVGSDATMNVAAGFTGAVGFWYSSSAVVSNAVGVWSGLNGTGSLLASFTLVGNAQSNGCTSSAFCRFDQLTSTFAGIGRSISFGNAANVAVFDDVSLTISAVPEASTTLLMAAGVLGMAGFMARRRG